MTYPATTTITTGVMMSSRHPILNVVAPLRVTCSPPLTLSDGRDILGLSHEQCDDLEYLLLRYYRSTVGALDPLPTGVGKSTSFDRPGSKRHKPESMPPPRCADPDEPDWTMVRLAEAVETRLTIVQQQLLRWRIHDRQTVLWCAQEVKHDKDWVEIRWGRLVTWLYFRAHGLTD